MSIRATGFCLALSLLVFPGCLRERPETFHEQAVRGSDSDSAPFLNEGQGGLPRENGPSVTAVRPGPSPGADDDIQFLEYTEITQDNLPELLQHIESENVEFVTTLQKEKLLKVLAKNIWGMKIGSSDIILESRLPVPYKINPETIDGIKQRLKWQSDVSESEIPEDPEELLRLWANRGYFGENGSGYANLYNALSPEGSRMTFRKSREMSASIQADLHQRFMRGIAKSRRGMAVPSPMVTFDNSPEDVLKHHSELLFVDIRIAASDADNDKYSRFKRYYWSPEDETWLPMEVVYLIAMKKPMRLDFF